MEAEKEYQKQYKEKAEAIFKLYNELPESVQRFIYKTIIDEVELIASTLPASMVKEAFADAFCSYIYYDGDDLVESSLKPIFRDNASVILEHIFKLMSRDINLQEFKEIVQSLPDIHFDSNSLIQSYPLFALQINDDFELMNRFKDAVSNTFLETEQERYRKEYAELLAKLFEDRKTLFCFLGYRTLAYNFSNLNLLENSLYEINELDKVLVYNWFIEGRLINPIFDTIFRGGSTAVSSYLWNFLVLQCKESKTLCELTQERYNEYKIIHPEVQLYTFVYQNDEGTIKEDTTIHALDQICHRNNGTPVNEDCLSKLFNLMTGNGRDLGTIVCSVEEFKAIFSGYGTILPRQFMWSGKKNELDAFLRVARGTRSSSIKYAEQAAKIFTSNRRHAEISTDALKSSTINEDALNKYVDIFNKSGIERNYLL